MNKNFFRLTKIIQDITNDCRDCNDIYIDGDDDISWLAVCRSCMIKYYAEEIKDYHKILDSKDV